MSRIEPIELREKRFNFLPACFISHGEPHRIWRVEEIWSRPARWRRPPRNYFRVRCVDNQVYQIVQDLRINAWYVEH